MHCQIYVDFHSALGDGNAPTVMHIASSTRDTYCLNDGDNWYNYNFHYFDSP